MSKDSPLQLKTILKDLSQVFNTMDLTEVEYQKGDTKLRLARKSVSHPDVPQSMHPQNFQNPPLPTLVSSYPEGKKVALVEKNPEETSIVRSPIIGTVYLSPDPDAPPYVKVGDAVQKGQTLLIVEAMKVMNPIRSPQQGVVKEILVHNAQPVEFDEKLITLEDA